MRRTGGSGAGSGSGGVPQWRGGAGDPRGRPPVRGHRGRRGRSGGPARDAHRQGARLNFLSSTGCGWSPRRSAPRPRQAVGIRTRCPQPGPQLSSGCPPAVPRTVHSASRTRACAALILAIRALSFEHRFERRGGRCGGSHGRHREGRPPVARLRPHAAAGRRGRAVACSAACCCRKDAIADVVEMLRPGDFYRPAHQIVFDADPRPLRPRRAGRRGHGRGRADPHRRAGPRRRRALPAHADLHRCRRRPTPATTRRSSRERAILRRLVEAGTRIVQLGYGAAGRQAATSTTSSTGPAGRSTTSPSGAPPRTTSVLERAAAADPGRDRGDRRAAAA